MIIFIINPFIDFVPEYIELSIKRCYKRRFVYNKIAYHDKYDFLKYIDLRAGPQYSFHSKLANTQLLVFMVIIFAPMLPILYPIAIGSLILQYLTDKLFLTYFYRLPPKYSEDLTL